MKRLLRRLFIPFGRDDLFLRVASFLAGLVLGGGGVAILIGSATQDLTPNIELICWVIAIPVTAWGGLLVSRCALSAQSRMGRFADKCLPDGQGEEGLALILVIYLPAALLTLLLRLFGVRGQRNSSMALGKRTRITRPPGGLPRPPT
jgi:cytochrome c biogenesis protein CcdA